MSRDWETNEAFTEKLESAKFPNEYPEWHQTKMQAFRGAVENLFKYNLSTQHKIEWKEENGQLRLTVISKDLGVLSINIEVEKIKSNKVPKDLPQQLLKAFDAQFETKIKRIVKRYEESNSTKQTDTKEDGLSSRGTD